MCIYLRVSFWRLLAVLQIIHLSGTSQSFFKHASFLGLLAIRQQKAKNKYMNIYICIFLVPHSNSSKKIQLSGASQRFFREMYPCGASQQFFKTYVLLAPLSSSSTIISSLRLATVLQQLYPIGAFWQFMATQSGSMTVSPLIRFGVLNWDHIVAHLVAHLRYFPTQRLH